MLSCITILVNFTSPNMSSAGEAPSSQCCTAQQGFGAMGFSAFYVSAQRTSPEQAKGVIRHVVNRGVTLINTATFYGPLNVDGYGANLRLLKVALEGINREQVQIMCKICMDTRAPSEETGKQWHLKTDLEFIQEDVNYTLQTLGTDYLDTIVLCRIPAEDVMPIEQCVANMKKIVDAGQARHIALSEVPSAACLRRAHAVHPIHCIEQEYSLWCRDIEEEILPVCRELGIKVVAYCPLGRGMLAAAVPQRSTLPPTDYRVAHSPKFSEENFAHNYDLVRRAQRMAEMKHISMAQLSLAWLHTKGDDIIPIPGTTSIAHFDENYGALHLRLSKEEMAELESIFAPVAVLGARY